MLALFVTWGKQDYKCNISYEVELIPRGSLPLYFSSKLALNKMYIFFFKYMFFGVYNKNLKFIFGGRI